MIDPVQPKRQWTRQRLRSAINRHYRQAFGLFAVCMSALYALLLMFALNTTNIDRAILGTVVLQAVGVVLIHWHHQRR